MTYTVYLEIQEILHTYIRVGKTSKGQKQVGRKNEQSYAEGGSGSSSKSGRQNNAWKAKVETYCKGVFTSADPLIYCGTGENMINCCIYDLVRFHTDFNK